MPCQAIQQSDEMFCAKCNLRWDVAEDAPECRTNGVSAATMIGGASDKHERNAADFYPTPEEVTVALMDRHPALFSGIVWEPACGDGDMAEPMEKRGVKVYSTDLRYTGYGIGGTDYLHTKPIPIPHSVVTNPPFKLAEQFIRKAVREAQGVAILTKATYWNAKSRMSLWNDCPPSWVHPLTWRPAMDPTRGKSATMDFIWNVWDGTGDSCRFEPLVRP